MNFDMGAAWDDAVALLRNNIALVATLVGLFYFLPYLAIGLLFPELGSAGQPDIPAGAAPEVVLEAAIESLRAQYERAWPALLFVAIAQYVGILATLALFSSGNSPTVGEALTSGLRGTPSYIATQLLFGLGLGLAFGLIIGVAAAFLPWLAIVLGLVGFVVVVFVSFRLVLVPAVIAMEGQLNPITAMKRSWALCKGKTRLIFVFLVLIFITMGIISLLASLGLTAVFSIFGESATLIGGAMVSGLTNAVTGAIVLVVTAAIYRQAVETEAPREIETFE